MRPLDSTNAPYACVLSIEIAVEDYKSVLHDIYLSEKLKIDLQYGKSLKDIIEKLCSATENDKFNESFVKVHKDLIVITKFKDSKKKPCFSKT